MNFTGFGSLLSKTIVSWTFLTLNTIVILSSVQHELSKFYDSNAEWTFQVQNEVNFRYLFPKKDRQPYLKLIFFSSKWTFHPNTDMYLKSNPFYVQHICLEWEWNRKTFLIFYKQTFFSPHIKATKPKKVSLLHPHC